MQTKNQLSIADLHNSRTEWSIKTQPTWIDYPDDAKECGADIVIQKVLAIALNLEIPAGKFVMASKPKDLPISEVAKACLIANAHDEGTHYQAFDNYAKVYKIPPEFMSESEAIAKEWENLATDKQHFLEVVAALETGLFQISLVMLRLFGSVSLARLGQLVAEDEWRHQATNRAVLRHLGINPAKLSNQLDTLMSDSLQWMLSGFTNDNDFELSVDDLIRYSNQLIQNGVSPELDSIFNDLGEYRPPFEVNNATNGYGY